MKLSSIAGAVALVIMTSCGACNFQGSYGNGKNRIALSGPTVERAVDISTFDGISSSSGIKVIYAPGPATEKAVINAPESIIDHIEVKVTDDNKLIVSLENDFSYYIPLGSKSDKPVVRITAPAVSHLNASSGSSITVTGVLRCVADLKVHTSSGANIICDYPVTVAGNIDVNASSGSLISLNSIKAFSVRCHTSSGAAIRTDNISAADYLHCDTSSGSSVEITTIAVSGKIECDASSGSSIKIDKGECYGGILKASSGASVSAKGLKSKSGFEKHKSSGGSVKTD